MKYLDSVPLSEVKLGEAGTEECITLKCMINPPEWSEAAVQKTCLQTSRLGYCKGLRHTPPLPKRNDPLHGMVHS